MTFYKLTLIFLISSTPAFAGSIRKTAYNTTKPLDGRIVGGINAQRNEFPFIISYQHISGQHFCGGVILTKDWVLTAAHCLLEDLCKTRVVAGVLNQGEDYADIQMVAILQKVIHPDYPGGKDPAPNDIGLLQLAWSLKWSYAVQPIALPRENQESSGLAWVAGWGYLSSSNPVTPNRLQQAQLELLTVQQCAVDLIGLIGSTGVLNNNMICGRGAYLGTENICSGDSGGPLVQNGQLIGIISWTLEPCGYYHSPSVCTKVSKFISFIRKYVPGV